MMWKRNKVYSRGACLLLGGALLLASGCSVQKEYPAALQVAEATPPPLVSDEVRTLWLPLYYLAADGRNLVEETRKVACGQEEGVAEAVLRELFEGQIPTGLTGAIPVDWRLSRVTISGDTAEAYVTAAGATSINAYLTGRAAVTNTLSAALGIKYCNVFVNEVLPGYEGRPMGAMQPLTGALDVYLANMKQTYAPVEPIQVTEAGEYESKDAILYFTDTIGRFLLADTRVVRYDAKASLPLIMSSLIQELIKGPVESEGREPVLPADMMLQSEVIIRSLSAEAAAAVPAQGTGIASPLSLPAGTPQPSPGEAKIVVEVSFSESNGAFNKKLVYGAIVYTVTSYCPNAVGVRILENGVAVRPETVGTQAPDELRDYLMRSDFSRIVGNTVPLAFPESDGSGLHRVMRCMDEALTDNLTERLLALFTGSADPGVPYAVFTANDVLGVYLQGDTAVVNWKAGFVETLRAYLESGKSQLPKNTREQMFLFGVVDTLTALPGVQRVWMLEDGQRILEGADLVFLGDPLLRNSGLLLD